MKKLQLKTKKSKMILFVVIAASVGFAIGGIVFAIQNKQNDAAQPSDSTVESQQAPPNNEVAQETPASTETTPKKEVTPASPAQASSQWPVQLTSSQASSLTVVVNKKHKLPNSYAPTLGTGGRLRTEADAAFNTLLAAAKTGGAPNMVYLSGYRSYARQEQLYTNYVAKDGKTAADTYSARPGFSEHQTGLAVDIGEGGGCDLETCFENTASGTWAAANAYKYGFVIRYPKGKDATTGYQYEPWHLRYLGVAEATAVYNSGKTLEEYYNTAGGSYN